MSLFDSISEAAKSALSNQGNTNLGTDPAHEVSNLVKQLYENSSDEQKQGMLKHVNDLLGPQASEIASKSLGIALPTRSTELSSAQVAALTPEQIQTFITLAHQQAPELTEHLSSFYAQHTGLLNAVGGAALAFITSPKKTA
jgi:hypothetical protein